MLYLVSFRSFGGRWASDSFGIRRGHQTQRKHELYTHRDSTPIRAVGTAWLSTKWGSEAAPAGIGLRISRSGVRIPPGAPYRISDDAPPYPNMLGLESVKRSHSA